MKCLKNLFNHLRVFMSCIANSMTDLLENSKIFRVALPAAFILDSTNELSSR